MTKVPPNKWVKNQFKNKDVYFVDGDEFLIAVAIKNEKTKEEYWQIDRVIVNCDGENMQLIPNDEAFDDWTWWDVDFYIRISASGPMTKKQLEGCI